MFYDKNIKPDEKMLSEALGLSYKYWVEIKNNLNKEYDALVEEWKYYGQKYGWTLKFFYKKRNLFFLKPYDNYFQIAFVFGNTAVSAIEKSDLPSSIINDLRNAKKYVEGRGLRIKVQKKNDVKNILTLVNHKITN
jgi:hypothetical protein